MASWGGNFGQPKEKCYLAGVASQLTNAIILGGGVRRENMASHKSSASFLNWLAKITVRNRARSVAAGEIVASQKMNEIIQIATRCRCVSVPTG
ncbi:hypothetical protein [Agrobacterium tumefaciens]|uniref:hypothetical protein n=1 Tax=Agrobacterium tumefaciens TaxID=358 RepID=UPI001571E303|nr:hypothetical protein [Agrobacterium tumefaciens]WCK01054.1 hypothetical protein G6L31_007160 [Agrobacterium tumefaciens]